MDLWIIAAAAGAGCIAKNLQNFTADKKESPRGPSLKYSNNVQTESRNFLQQLRDKTCPLRRLAQKRVEDDSDVRFPEMDGSNVGDGNVSGAVSVKDDYSDKSAVFEDYNFSAGVVGVGENQQFVDGENKNLSKINDGKMGRKKRCHMHSFRPLGSLGSCVENMEHNSCLYPSMSPARSLLATDPTWSETSPSAELDACQKEMRNDSITLSSSSSLKQFESSEELKKPKKGSNRLQQSGRSQADTMLVFITGMTIGILSATSSGKNEVDRLNKQLNQMQSLVQDLHEELEMREMVMVKEIQNEEDDSPPTIKEPISSPSLVTANDKKAESLDLLSRIEAELQAELEMLEQNLKASEQYKISSFVELNPDFEPEIVRGELKPSVVEDATESGSKTTDSMTTDYSKPANYSVSPLELSLKLHELIESRLETRIKELEIALLHSLNGVGIQHGIVSDNRYSYSETESSSTHQSPTCICDEEHATRLRSVVHDEDSASEDEGSNESEMLLIKRIIERRKSGSGLNFI